MVPTSVPKSDIHAIIQFLPLENVLGHEIHCRLCAEYKNVNTVLKSTVNLWLKSFIEERTSIDDKPYSVCPLENVNDETIAIVHAFLEEDQQQTICEIEQ